MTNGLIELDSIPGISPEQKARAERYDAAARLKMSPDWGLPRLLESRRMPWCMVDRVFDEQAAFDKVYVFQIDDDLLQGSLIALPDTTREAMRYRAPLGIIVSAGLKAMDILRSNGFDIGHIVRFVTASPYRIEVDYVLGKPVELQVMNVGDLVGSKDLAKVMRSGVVKVQCVNDQHVLVDEDGHQWNPVVPWSSPDQP